MKELTYTERDLLEDALAFCEVVSEEIHMRLQETWRLKGRSDKQNINSWLECIDSAKSKLKQYQSSLGVWARYDDPTIDDD